MTKPTRMASRYAKALWDLCKDKNRIERLIEECNAFDSMLKAHSELSQVFWSRAFSALQKRQVLEALFEKLQYMDLTSRLIFLLMASRRLHHLGQVSAALHLLWLSEKGIMPVEIETAWPLEDEKRLQLEKALEEHFQQKVFATYHTHRHLIGGVRVLAEGRSYDGTARGWLKGYEQSLREDICSK